MPDLHDLDLERRLRGADHARMPDLWPTATERASNDGPWTASLEPSTRRRLVAATTALALAAGAIGVLVWSFRDTRGPAPSALGKNGVIVTVGRGADELPGLDNTDLIAIDPTTNARWNITNTPEAESQPVWSPDGTRVAFFRTTTTDEGRTFDTGLFVMHTDGTGIRRVEDCGTDSSCREATTAWSPDDTHLVVVQRTENDRGARLTIFGDALPRSAAICDTSSCAGPLGFLALSPDGSRVAYTGNPFTHTGIGALPPESVWTVDLDSLAVNRVTEGDDCDAGNDLAACFTDVRPAWSPDSSRIAFVRTPSLQFNPGGPPPPAPVIGTVDVATGDQRTFEVCGSTQCNLQAPIWSSDGASIVTATYTRIPRAIVAVNLTSGHTTTIASLGDGPCIIEGDPTWSPDNRSIAFVGGSKGQNICVVPAEGGTSRIAVPEFLPRNAYAGFAWLPAGAVPIPPEVTPSAEAPQANLPLGPLPVGTLAFVSQNGTAQGGNASNLWVVTADQLAARAISTGAAYARNPSLSPDGTRVAFEGTIGNGRPQIWLVGTDGSGLTRLTNLGSGADSPAWSPDGTRIAFLAHEPGQSEGIYVMNAEGTEERLIQAGIATSPAWTPDGSGITFAASTPDRDFALETVDIATGTIRPTLVLSGDVSDPAWSPDGSTIAFMWSTEGGFGPYLVDPDGSNLRRVPIAEPGGGGPIAWSPDGEWLALRTDNLGTGGQVEVIRPDGSDAHRIADVSQLVTGPGPSGPNSDIRDQTSDPSWGPSPT